MTTKAKALEVMRGLQPLTELGIIASEDASRAVQDYLAGNGTKLFDLVANNTEKDGKYSCFFENVLKTLAK